MSSKILMKNLDDFLQRIVAKAVSNENAIQ